VALESRDAEIAVTNQVVAALRQIIRAVDAHSRTLVKQYQLTGPQLVVLKRVADGEFRSIGELARTVYLSQATVTGILDRLEARGLVQRARALDDRRRVTVTLSPAGEQILQATPPLLQEHFIRRFLQLADWERSQVLSSLQRIVTLMEAKDIDATPILATGPIDASSEGTEAFLEDEADRT
jgi:DNA-binding MarR family transcriptional regulator